MKRIIFSDKYGLTDAVLDSKKTMTRHIIPQLMSDKDFDISDWGLTDGGKAMITLYEGGRPTTDIFPMYQPGEVVAVAQSYKALGYTKKWVEQHIRPNPNANWNDPFEKKYPGWNNKMFTHSELEKVRKIEITDIKVERLQDISDEDCLKEGVVYDSRHWVNGYEVENLWNKIDRQSHFRSAQVAFANLINRISGKGTWESNPYVFVYSFKLIK